MPDDAAGDSVEIWSDFFSRFRPAPAVVRRWVLKLHNEGKHPRVIALIQAALIHGQAQPWMYEVLALSMEIENHPKEDVERVVLSLADFGQVDYSTMMYSGAYLTRFGRKSAALTMYRQSSRMFPDRPEPYVLGLKLARDSDDPEALLWAANGILLNYWLKDYEKQHQTAELAVLERVRQLRRGGRDQAADELFQSMQEAKSRDLEIRLDWSGDGDLDLYVEEPYGTVCSFEMPLTPGGGIHLRDGYGPAAENCHEVYVCPRGASGPYRITVRLALGSVVGDRATLTIVRHKGLPTEQKLTRTVVLEGGEASLTVDLRDGRRTQPRDLSFLDVIDAWPPVADVDQRRTSRALTPQQRQVRREFLADREAASQAGSHRAGAFAVAPQVQLFQEGTSMTARAVVSPDRRYVRLAISPMFSNITDVFTFSYINSGTGGAPAQGGR